MSGTATSTTKLSLYGDPADPIVGFGAAVNGREHEFPLLARALVGAKPAVAPTVEWLIDGPNGHESGGKNECQIVRVPFGHLPIDSPATRRGRKDEKLTEILGIVEQILWDGVPRVDEVGGCPIRWCGGVRHLLGRDPVDGDRISLSILRDLVYRSEERIMRDDPPPHQSEWLAEFSLIARPAKS